MFPTRKFGTAVFVQVLLLILLKWSVDVCLPNLDNSRVFPVALAAPRSVCEPIRNWDLSSRARSAQSQAMRNFYNPTPSVFETEDGRPAFFIFSKDLLKLTVLLSKVPRDPFAIFQLGVVLLISSTLIALLWELGEWVVSTPVEVRPEVVPMRSPPDATRSILPSYLTQRAYERKPGGRGALFERPNETPSEDKD